MWMETYETYLQHLLGGAGGDQDTLLRFAPDSRLASLVDEALVGFGSGVPVR